MILYPFEKVEKFGKGIGEPSHTRQIWVGVRIIKKVDVVHSGRMARLAEIENREGIDFGIGERDQKRLVPVFPASQPVFVQNRTFETFGSK